MGGGVKSCAAFGSGWELRARELLIRELDGYLSGCFAPGRRQRQEVRQQAFSIPGRHGFGVELNTVNRQAPVTNCHDFMTNGTISRPGSDLELWGQMLPRDHERVIPHNLDG